MSRYSIKGGFEMLTDNENTNNEGIFGVARGSIQTYALIHISWEKEKALIKEIRDKSGDYLTMQDGEAGFGNGFIFNISPEEIISLAPRYDIDEFIFGEENAPSTPYFYQKDENGTYKITSNETISSYRDLEIIAPKCSDIWEDLYFNDFFIESLYSWFGYFEEDGEDDES